MNKFKLLAIAAAALSSALAAPQVLAASDRTVGTTIAQAGAPAGDLAEGEVRKVDKETSKLTLKHGEIKSLDMPPMTMVFSVKDKALLDKVKAGDKVKFKAVNEAGKYTVIEIQAAP